MVPVFEQIVRKLMDPNPQFPEPGNLPLPLRHPSGNDRNCAGRIGSLPSAQRGVQLNEDTMMLLIGEWD
jgi:hypothetical protein